MLLVISWRLQPQSVGLIRQARLGDRKLTFERLHTPASPPEFAPRSMSGNPDASSANEKTGEHGQKDEKVKGRLEKERERPQPERHGGAIGNGERDQHRRGNEGDRPKDGASHSAGAARIAPP